MAAQVELAVRWYQLIRFDQIKPDMLMQVHCGMYGQGDGWSEPFPILSLDPIMEIVTLAHPFSGTHEFPFTWRGSHIRFVRLVAE